MPELWMRVGSPRLHAEPFHSWPARPRESEIINSLGGNSSRPCGNRGEVTCTAVKLRVGLPRPVYEGLASVHESVMAVEGFTMHTTNHNNSKRGAQAIHDTPKVVPQPGLGWSRKRSARPGYDTQSPAQAIPSWFRVSPQVRGALTRSNLPAGPRRPGVVLGQGTVASPLSSGPKSLEAGPVGTGPASKRVAGGPLLAALKPALSARGSAGCG